MDSWNYKPYMFCELFIESVKENRMLYIKYDKLYRNREAMKCSWAAIGAHMEISGYERMTGELNSSYLGLNWLISAQI